jgi:hypothetical protein
MSNNNQPVIQDPKEKNMLNPIKTPLMGIALIALLGLGADVYAQAATAVRCTGCVGTGDIANTAVTTGKIKNSAVTTGKIKAGAVTTVKIKDSAVTTGKIRNGAVTTAKIIYGAVTTGKIRDGAVTGSKISGSIAIAASAFNPVLPTTSFTNTSNGGFGVLDDGGGAFRYPITLPAGTAIKQIYLKFFDASTTQEVDVTLERVLCNPNCATSVTIASAGSTLAQADGYDLQSSGVFNEVIFPGPDYFYWLELKMSGNGPVYAYSVTVEYGAP